MSLRAARSLPSLRSAFQSSVKRDVYLSPLPRTQPFSSTSYQQAPSKKKTLTKANLSATRNVHQTSQTESLLLHSHSNKYATMNLQALKTECRSRKLKVSGKKLELIQRLSNYESAKLIDLESSRDLSTTTSPKVKEETKKQLKEFQKKITRRLSNASTAKRPTINEAETKVLAKVNVAPPQAKKALLQLALKLFSTTPITDKNPNATVDALKFPSADNEPPSLKEQISAPTLISKPKPLDDLVTTETKIADMDGAVSVGPDSEGSVNVFENIFRRFNLEEGAGSENAEEAEQEAFAQQQQAKFEPSTQQISSTEKLVFLSIFAGVFAWWSLKPSSE